ncbi:copper-translocating P-type ATPase [Niabella terrae]
MSCQGCRSRVETALNQVPGVDATVSLEPPQATIVMSEHIPTATLQAAISPLGHYSIHPQEENHNHPHQDNQPTVLQHAAGTHGHAHPTPAAEPHRPGDIYYCPMHCEGEKTYDQPGNCPVCGMNLVKAPSLRPTQTAGGYTCPMHPEVFSQTPGTCPRCGMDLVAIEPEDGEDQQYLALKRKFILSVLFTLPVFVLAMAPMLAPELFQNLLTNRSSNWIQLFLTLPVVFYSGWMFFQRAWSSVKSRHLNMFTLIGLGTAAAFLFSIAGILFPGLFPQQFKAGDGSVHLYFEAVAVILTLALLGQLMEARAHARTSKAISQLLELAPATTIRITGNREEEVRLEDIHPGDILKIKPGAKIPVDGIITEGYSVVDESMITGEPIPVEKSLRDQVSSGTINGNHSFLMKAVKVGADTLLARIIDMVHQASRSKAPIQKLADKISGWFVPVVILIAIATAIIWTVWGGPQGYVYALVNAVAVLIVACPCALGLATPMSVMVGVGKGAQLGVLIKNAAALETMNRVDLLITDKTGTLTEGQPSLQEIISVGQYDPQQLLGWAASVNQESEHPLAAAITRTAHQQNLPAETVTAFENLPGKGVRGRVGDRNIYIGNAALMESLNILPASSVQAQVTSYQRQGSTVSYIAVDQRLEGLLLITDAIKESSIQAIRSLQAAGLELMMVTGDHANTAAHIAAKLGIQKYQAQALPQDKLEAVRNLQASGRIVAMAGDGINDAPALAQSDVGIAMGTGTDIAIESAGITLVKGNLNGIVKARKLSHAVMRNIRQNLFFAFFYNALGVPIAAGILYPAFNILMSPMIAAAAMSFSSVSVIFNALRLRHKKI